MGDMFVMGRTPVFDQAVDAMVDAAIQERCGFLYAKEWKEVMRKALADAIDQGSALGVAHFEESKAKRESIVNQGLCGKAKSV